MSEPTLLYLVPTPIGNLEDITLRAIKTLQEKVDTILAEDTRKTGLLLQHLKLKKPLQSYHIFNEHQTVTKIVARLKQGEKMALVSDAGTPGISDPGFLLVRASLQENIKVECLPGPTALIPALLKSGFPADKFVFEGFLPHKKGRKTRLELLAKEPRTIILYESPHRLLKTLGQIKEHFGENRQISVSRELTKLYEETINGSIEEVINHFSEGKIKGEIVIVINGAS